MCQWTRLQLTGHLLAVLGTRFNGWVESASWDTCETFQADGTVVSSKSETPSVRWQDVTSNFSSYFMNYVPGPTLFSFVALIILLIIMHLQWDLCRRVKLYGFKYNIAWLSRWSQKHTKGQISAIFKAYSWPFLKGMFSSRWGADSSLVSVIAQSEVKGNHQDGQI